MTKTEMITIIALFVGPLLAVGIQLFFEQRRKRLARQFELLDTLMAYRRNMTNIACVGAINRIDLVFYKFPSVRSRLKTLFDHMERERTLPDNEKAGGWDKRADLFAELISEIANVCGYNFDHTVVKDNSYHPQGYVDEATYTNVVTSSA